MTTAKICEVDGCGNTASRGKLCNTHYLRLRRHGDIHHKTRASDGEPQAWLRQHINHEGEGCLTWPFAKGRDGRGRLQKDVSPQAHRAMCILAHGEPPSPIHEAAHSCGKGHDACVHPKHLRWAMPVDNAADRKIHGTECRGENKPTSKLRQVDVVKIMGLRGQMTQREIGAMFGVDSETVGSIHRQETWAWLTQENITPID